MKNIQLAPRARADLRKLDRDVARQILAAIDRYANTGKGDVVKLKGQADEYRLRIRAWRVRFSVESPHTLNILRILPRSQACR